jgi:cell division protein FtsQ
MYAVFLRMGRDKFMNQNVIYDERIPRIKEQPKKQRSNWRFLLLLFLFFIVILIVLYFQSPYSKLKEIQIIGNHILTQEQIYKKADIRPGISYFNFRTSGVEDRLKSMVEIEQVTVERIFPNRLQIKLNELPVVAFWYKENELYPILSSGHVLLNRPWTTNRVERPIISNWPTKEGIIELSRELEKLPLSVAEKISEITMTPIISDPYRLTLYMVDGYEVRTSIRNFAENMSWYPYFVRQTVEEGKKEGIFYLLDGKWYEDPTQIEEKEKVEDAGEKKGEQ